MVQYKLSPQLKIDPLGLCQLTEVRVVHFQFEVRIPLVDVTDGLGGCTPDLEPDKLDLAQGAAHEVHEREYISRGLRVNLSNAYVLHIDG